MWRGVIPTDGTVSLLGGSLGFDNPVVVVAVGIFAVLTILVLLVAVRTVAGSSEGTDDGGDSSDSMPDESEWTVSYNPPSRKSKRSSRSKRSSSSGSSSQSSGGASASGGRSGSSSRSSTGGSSASGSASGASGASGASSASGSASADGGSSAATADGSGETRLYDPATGEPAGTDTQIFTGEKRDGKSCPDCGESTPSGTDWEFCPFCGFEL